MEHIVGYPKTDNRYGGIASNKTREPTNSNDRAYKTNVVPNGNMAAQKVVGYVNRQRPDRICSRYAVTNAEAYATAYSSQRRHEYTHTDAQVAVLRLRHDAHGLSTWG